MNDFLAFLVLLVIGAAAMSIAMTTVILLALPIFLIGVLIVPACWIGWAFFDRWWVERKAENSNPNRLSDPNG